MGEADTSGTSNRRLKRRGMNLIELILFVANVAVGVWLGGALKRRFGWVGFPVGFVAGFLVLPLLLYSLAAITGRRRTRLGGNGYRTSDGRKVLSADGFRALAQTLNALEKSPSAEPFYDLLADALVWNDEIPGPQTPEGWTEVLRPLWHYRTHLLVLRAGEAEFAAGIAKLGASPDVAYFRRAWGAAKAVFPQWPGFDPSRSDPCLAETYKRLEASATAALEDLPS